MNTLAPIDPLTVHPERMAEIELYTKIFNLVCKHGKSRDKILKTIRFKFNKDGTLCTQQTFEWHWKKIKK